MGLDTPAFRCWAGTAAPSIFGTDIVDHDWRAQGPHILQALHGTTHAFHTFTLDRAHHESQFGKVFYFTSCRHDAARNYAAPDGPDLQQRLATRTERLEEEIWDSPEDFGMSTEATSEDIAISARAMAEKEVIGTESRILPVWLRLDRPFVIDASGKSDRAMFSDQEEDAFERACRDVGENHGISEEEIAGRMDEFEDEINEVLDARWDDIYRTIEDALYDISGRLDCEVPEMPEFDTPLPEIGCNDFETAFRRHEKNCYLENEDGDLVSNTVFSALLERLGFDSIVLLNADHRFATMDMKQGTSHIHLFADRAAMIKSQMNCGRYDPDDPDIRA